MNITMSDQLKIMWLKHIHSDKGIEWNQLKFLDDIQEIGKVAPISLGQSKKLHAIYCQYRFSGGQRGKVNTCKNMKSKKIILE